MKLKGYTAVNFFIPDAVHEKVRTLSFRKNQSMAQIMRKYISDQVIKEFDKLQVSEK